MALLSSVALIATSAFGQQAPAPSTPVTAETLAKYDANKNGVLDASELTTMEADQARVARGLPPSPESGQTRDEVIELSPFEVKSDNDRGYFASNTMSGTRLNSKIEDLAASITVVTKQQLLDTAALDINDIFLYEGNTEGTGNYSAFEIDRNGNMIDSIQGNPESANRMRGIAAANVAVGGFAASSRVPFDTFNVDAVEISRGPNTTIFGVGDAAGGVNIIRSRGNVTRESTQLQARIDSYGGWRTSFDINRPLIRQKLAFRLSAVHEERGYVRKPSEDRTNRLQAAFTAKPFRNTTITGSYESYHNFARRPNSNTPRDTVTDWRAAGSPTWDPLTQTAKINGVAVPSNPLPAGLNNGGTGFDARPSVYFGPSGVELWMVNRVAALGPNNGSPANTGGAIRFMQTGSNIQRNSGTLPLFRMIGISDRSLYDWGEINYAASNWRKTKSDIYEVNVEQIFFNTPRQTLALQAGWHREDSDDVSRNIIGQNDGASAAIIVDVNERLLDGSPNPFFLRPYIGGTEPQIFKYPERSDQYRGMLAYQLNLTKEPNLLKWLGRHNLSGYAEYRDVVRSDTGLRHRDVVISDNAWVPNNKGSGAAHTRMYPRHYLGDANGQNIDYAPSTVASAAGTHDFRWFNGATGQWVTEKATIGEAFFTGNLNQRVVKTQGGSIQSYLLGDRIIPMFGWRRDSNNARRSNGGQLNPNTRFIDMYPGFDTWRDWITRSGKTNTKSVVVRPISWLQFSYQTSNSFNPADLQYNLFGELLPDPSGQTKEYGAWLSLFKNKLSFRVTKYETLQEKSRKGENGIIATRANRMDFGTDGFNLEDLATQWVEALNPAWTAQQKREEVYKIMGLPGGFIENMSGKNVSETSDVFSKGYEFEINYNPSSNWTLKVNATQRETIDTKMSPNIQTYIDQRLAHWQQVVNPTNGTNWFTTGTGSGQTPAQFLAGSVIAPYRIAIANEGKRRSQDREWSFNALTTYKLAALFDNKHLRATSLTLAARWQDKAAIGYHGLVDPDGIMRSLDKSRPIFDKVIVNFDFGVSYTTRLFSDKIRSRFQLNVRNLTESGNRLQVTGVNPDGTPFNYRIVDPRQFILTTTFDF